METTFGSTRIIIKQGDITQEDSDGIVNAANSSLMGGGGVDGAIHRAGGPTILEECKQIAINEGGCAAGDAVITGGGNLVAKYVVHTVGPIWNGGDKGEPEILANAYRNSLSVAAMRGIRTIAFPSISTGVYGYPIEKASRVALEAVRKFCEEFKQIEEIRFVLFSDADLKVYENAIKG